MFWCFVRGSWSGYLHRLNNYATDFRHNTSDHCTGERSFSALKYNKNYLRSTMGEQRLNGLAHMYINRDIDIDYDLVIDEFGRNNRRLKFV